MKFKAKVSNVVGWSPNQPEVPVRVQVGLTEISLPDSVPNTFKYSLEVLSDNILELEDSLSLIVFLTLPAAIRVERLRARELARYGRIDPDFLDWAAQYDEGHMEGRSRIKHERWLSDRDCRVVRIEGDLTVQERKERVIQALSSFQAEPGLPSV